MRRQVQRWTLLLLVVLGSSCGYKPVLRQYYASCSQGLVPALEKELSSAPIGATRIVPGKRGCEFWGPEEMGYQALLWSRVANGVWELLQRRERVFDREDLYTMVRRMPWEQLMDVDQTLAVQCIVGESVSRDVSHSHYSSLTVKNAIIDLFRDRDPQGRRPSVDTEAPDLPLICYIHRDEVSLYRSLSGLSSMHKRGYRDAMHVASLRETLAAAMLVMADYDPESQVLCDPMCGSGTIAIEGALMARRIAPGLLRLRKSRSAASLAPAAWPDTDTTLLRQTILDARNAMRDSAPMPILANDVHRGACSLCDRDAFAAGVSEDVTLSNFDVLEFKPEVAPDLVVTNPPWDLRLTEGAGESWPALGTWLKREAAGGEAWALSGNPELTRNLFMKATRRINIEQSGIKLRLLNYEVLKPKPRPTEEEGEGAFKPRVTEEEQDLVSE